MNWKQLNLELNQVKAQEANTGDVTFFNTENDRPVFTITNGLDCMLSNFEMVDFSEQRKILDFLSQDKYEWYKDHYYNVIIGKSTDEDSKRVALYYKKNSNSDSKCFDVRCEDLDCIDKDEYVFSIEEVEDLKAALGKPLDKTVDLCKKEVEF